MTEGRDLGRRTWVALLWSYAGAVLRALLQLAFQLALARLLGPEAFGQASLALLVLGFGWILSEAGFGSALIQKPDLTDADVRYAMGWVLTLSTVLGAVVAAGSGLLAAWLGDPSARWLLFAAGCLVPVQAASNIPASLMRRRLEAKQAQLIYLSGYALSYGLLGLPLAVLGAGAWALFAAFAAHTVFNFAVGCHLTRCPLRPSLRGDAALRRFGVKVTLANMANWASENVDRLLVSRFWGTAALGAYGAAANLSRAPANLMLGSLQSVAFSSAARVQQSPAVMAQAYRGMLAGVGVLSWPLLVAMAVQGDNIIHLLYGARWLGAGPLFSAFCIALLPFTVLGVTGPLLWAVDAVKADIQGQLLTLALLVAGFLALARQPLQVAVWAVLPAYLARSAWMAWSLSRALGLGMGQLLSALAGGAVLTLLAGLAAGAARWAGGPLAQLGLTVLLAALVVGAALWLAPRFFLGPLRPMLLARAGDVAALRRLCHWLRLEKP